jgi:hypothetical protein
VQEVQVTGGADVIPVTQDIMQEDATKKLAAAAIAELGHVYHHRLRKGPHSLICDKTNARGICKSLVKVSKSSFTKHLQPDKVSTFGALNFTR